MRIEELLGPADAVLVHEAWGRRFAAMARLGRAWLRQAGLSLARRRGPRGVPEIEFYAEAAAPEGALFAEPAPRTMPLRGLA